MPAIRPAFFILPILLAVTALLYSSGLDGPFLFDDHVHISQNKWVKIDSLAWADLVQAWGSSFSPFPTNRPLAQLSFGINHALAGPDPWAFKATNLVIHLLNGLFIYVLVRLVHRAVHRDGGDPATGQILALATAGLWLVHPIHVSTVLYTVQRMAQISTLGLLVAMSCYFWGRIQIANGRPGVIWILSAVPAALVGFLGKENAALLPLLLLVSEATVLRGLSTAQRPQFMRLVWLFFIALPIVAALIYFTMHPGYFNYDGRPFSLEERVLTQARVLWLYLQWLFIPDISAFGLFHDDIPVSTGLVEPPTTLAAVAALGILAVMAVLLRNRAPVFSFGVLIFLASHALESSAFPLEMVFEHRNYLASVGPLLLLAYTVIITARRFDVGRLALPLGALLLMSYAVVTYLRAENWSSYQRFLLSSAENHPKSARSNFMAAQLLISSLQGAGKDTSRFASHARELLNRGLEADARCTNCLFGLVVLDLHLGQKPGQALIDRLATALRTGGVGPTEVSISQFSYLVKWSKSDGETLQPAQLEAIFDAALMNPGWSHTGRGGIEAAYREYYEFVRIDYDRALRHAQAAVAAWPQQWSYHMQLVQVLNKLGRDTDALIALEKAAPLASNEKQRMQMEKVRALIKRANGG